MKKPKKVTTCNGTRAMQRPAGIRPVMEQLELRLGGINLAKEEWEFILQLAQMRRQLAQS